jgi:hypothetical protein
MLETEDQAEKREAGDRDAREPTIVLAEIAPALGATMALAELCLRLRRQLCSPNCARARGNNGAPQNFVGASGDNCAPRIALALEATVALAEIALALKTTIAHSEIALALEATIALAEFTLR